MSFQSTCAYFLPTFSALILGSGGLFVATDGLNAITDEGARRYNVERRKPQLPEFVLEDMTEKKIVIGGELAKNEQITVVEFIYTSCPTICQSAGAYYARLRNKIKETGLDSKVRLLSVSFDPDNDAVSDLSDYGELHEADGEIWTVARIRKEDLERLKDSFGVIIITDELGGYQHNSGMHIIDRSGRLVAIHGLEDIDGVMRRLVN